MRIQEEQAAHEERAVALRQLAQSLAGALKDLGAQRVMLVGSLADKDAVLHAGTDLDLCVWGLPKEQLDDLTFKLLEDTGEKVDLIRGEDLSPSFRRLFEQYGKEI